MVAHGLDLRWSLFHVEDGLALFAGAAAAQALDDFIHRQFVVDDGAERKLVAFQELF